MNEFDFWKLIDASREEARGDVEIQVSALVRDLATRNEESIADFERHFLRFMDEAYDTRLWAAGCILDELSNDGFLDFRAWLISRGKDAYSRSLEDPEVLAEIVAPGERVTSEEMNSVAFNAYAFKTGREDFFEKFHFEVSSSLKNDSLEWKTHEGYPDSDRLCVIFPALCARFGKPS